jgi:hypothetical protein
MSKREMMFNTENENRVFRPVLKGSKSLAIFKSTCFVLLTLSLTIAKWTSNEASRNSVWWDSPWIVTLVFVVSLFLLADDLYKIYFLRLVLTENGIYYHQLARKVFIPWEQVERIGIVRYHRDGNSDYGLILKSPVEIGSNFLLSIVKSHKQAISLSIFTEEWFVSVLRSEIKHLQPSLPLQ